MNKNLMTQKQQAPMAINVKLEDLQTIKCSCESTVFYQNIVEAKIIPAICSPNGQATLVQRPCLMCVKCGKIYPIDEIVKGG